MSLHGDERDALTCRREALLRMAGGLGDQLELAEIDLALRRLVSGHYGQCETCGGAIGRGRLRAMPEARRCVSCDGAVFTSSVRSKP